MFKRFENWLRNLIDGCVRRLIADEVRHLTDAVSRLDASLKLERQALEAHVASLNEALARLNELSYFKENTALRDHVRQIEGQLAGIVDSFKKLHPTT
jgi:hypothetical protein